MLCEYKPNFFYTPFSVIIFKRKVLFLTVKLKIVFPATCSFEVGASVDPAGVTMLDSIKIYGKTKEQFGWPEDPPEDFSSASVNNVCSPNLSQSNGTSDGDIVTPTATSGSVIERFVLH